MKLLIVFGLVAIFAIQSPSIAKGNEKRDLTERQLSLLKQISKDIIKGTHRALDNEINERRRKFKLTFHPLNNPQYYFQSNFTISRLLFGVPKYKIQVNPLVFDKGISDNALRGVLAHELMHSIDYYTGSTIASIIPIGLKVSRKKSRRQYERKTDLRIVLLGYGDDLIEYKKFQYPLLNEKQLTRKKLEYLTPEEILLIESIRFKYPKLISHWLKKKIPLNLKSFQEELNEYILSL
jgi:hypothetical protein